jgi:hypothetical protein
MGIITSLLTSLDLMEFVDLVLKQIDLSLIPWKPPVRILLYLQEMKFLSLLNAWSFVILAVYLCLDLQLRLCSLIILWNLKILLWRNLLFNSFFVWLRFRLQIQFRIFFIYSFLIYWSNALLLDLALLLVDDLEFFYGVSRLDFWIILIVLRWK